MCKTIVKSRGEFLFNQTTDYNEFLLNQAQKSQNYVFDTKERLKKFLEVSSKNIFRIEVKK